MVKFFVTTRCLTKGEIIEVEGEVCHNTANIMLKNCNFQNTYYFKPDWHDNEAEAVAEANKKRTKKIESLKKQIKKLEKMEFVIKSDYAKKN